MKGLICFVTLISLALAAPKPEVPSGRVVGGENAGDDQFPYQVSVQGCILGILCSHICGGTIIGPTTVLTAGHCILSSYSYRVIVGVTRLSDTHASRQQITAASTAIHPEYPPDSSSVAPHDIALIRLSQSIVWNTAVQSASLPFHGEEPFGTAILSGWGTTGTTTSPDHLQWVNLLIIEYQQCLAELTTILGGNTNIPLHQNGNVCTSGLGGLSACNGDSGGPLVQNNVLVGIVSWGITPCGQSGAPSVFVKTSNYVDWITANSYDFNGQQPPLTLGVY